MSKPPPSRFGQNLFLQFILFIILFAASTGEWGSSSASSVLGMLATIVSLTFTFGLLYGIFRLFGIESPAFESFYQSFPIPSSIAAGQDNHQHAPRGFGTHELEHPEKATKADDILEPHYNMEPINWSKVFSFQFLRVVAVLLIITAVFSLLFQIDWDLTKKIIASAVAGLLLMGTAEWLKGRKTEVAPFCAILGFALLQFTLSLMYQYTFLNHFSGLFSLADTWLLLKLALSLLMLWSVSRYKAPWSPLLFVIIAYFSPTSLQYLHGVYTHVLFSAPVAALFIGAMTAVAFFLAKKHQRAELLPANAVLSSIYVGLLLFQNAQADSATNNIFLAMVLILFIVHLFAGVVSAVLRRRETSAHVSQYLTVILSHVLVVIGLIGARGLFPLIDNNFGIALLVVANVTLIAYLLAEKMKADQSFADMLFNLAIIIASAGLFLQVNGRWSAVIFLAYATLVLWYSLYRLNIRTRIYGSVLLVVSLVKLYLEFSAIFNDVWGSLAILAIGLLLLVLSYKFEDVKDVMVHGLKPSSK